jgi:hypothetical protein
MNLARARAAADEANSPQRIQKKTQKSQIFVIFVVN